MDATGAKDGAPVLKVGDTITIEGLRYLGGDKRGREMYEQRGPGEPGTNSELRVVGKWPAQ